MSSASTSRTGRYTERLLFCLSPIDAQRLELLRLYRGRTSKAQIIRELINEEYNRVWEPEPPFEEGTT